MRLCCLVRCGDAMGYSAVAMASLQDLRLLDAHTTERSENLPPPTTR